jgi:EAL domain-containing protein (putative c-di-GMP-specific phosphodiesterase class I)
MDVHDQNASLAEWESELRNALDNREFEVYYQPLIDLNNSLPVGFEALVRWNHPRLGLVSPSEFLMIAEQTDLIVPIGDWVLRTACRQVRGWQETFNPPSGLTIGVNLSAKQFKHADLTERVENTLRETRLPAGCLILEVSERNIMLDIESSDAVLRRLGSVGVQLAMDDFGLGYSSLAWLHRIPLDILKLDRPFVTNMAVEAEGLRVASMIISLTTKLGIKTIAEGVESKSQADMLRSINCRYAQGYYYSRPLTADAAEAWLADHFSAASRPTFMWTSFEGASPQFQS